MKRTKMCYDQTQDQWYVDLQGRKYGLHCGESLELYIGHQLFPCRLELANKWYVVLGNAQFDLREDDQYTVNV